MPDNKPVAFNRESANLIGRVVKEVQGRGRGQSPFPKRRRVISSSAPPAASGAAKFGKATETIPAATVIGDTGTAGSGTVTIWEISGTTLTATETTETWYNISDFPIGGGFIQAKEINGQMIIDFEDCAPSPVEE